MLERFGITNRNDLAALSSLILLVAITPSGNEATHPVVLALYRTLLWVLVYLYAVAPGRSALTPLSPYFLAALGATLLGMLASMAAWPGSLVEASYRLYENLLFAAAFVALAHGGAARTVRWKNTVLAAVVLIAVAWVFVAMVAVDRPLKGPFVNPNYLASFVLPALAVCTAAVAFRTSLRLRLLATVVGVFLFYSILQTSSRGATLAAAAIVGLAALRAASFHGVSHTRMALAIALLLALSLGAIAASPTLTRKFLDRGERDPYNYQRTAIWRETVFMIAQRPILGVGLGHYYHVAKQFTPAVEGTIARYMKWPNIAHSEYLQYIAETGLPTALLLFGMAGYVLTLAWKRAGTVPAEHRSIQEAGILAAVGLAAHALVDNNWTVPVLAAGLAVTVQADLLPYRQGIPSTWSPLWRPAMAVVAVLLWIDGVAIPGTGLYFNELGHNAFVANDLKTAERDHRLALGFLPRHPVLIDNLGLVYLEQYRHTHSLDSLDRAEAAFSDSMKENPFFDLPPNHLESVLIERLTGDPARDVTLHRRIIDTDRLSLETNPFSPFVRKNMAEGLYNLGERELALAELSKAVQVEPNYVPGYLRLAEWEAELGRAADAERFRQQAFAIVNRYKDQHALDPFEERLLGRPQVRK